MKSAHLLFQRYLWQSSSCGKLFFTGHVSFQQSLLNADCLVQLLVDECEEIQYDQFQHLNGFFAIAIKLTDKLVLCTDRVRSFPLFYRVSEGQITVSDDCFCVAEEAGTDELIAQEFAALGYVTGNDTLFCGTRQVPAGTHVCVRDTGISQLRYFTFKRSRLTLLRTEAQVLEQLHHVMSSVIDECIKMAGGRQIVVPLSGGYDSRAILLFLKKAGYENILTFTFGGASSPELKLAGQLASELNVRWHPVIYTARLWRELRKDLDFAHYIRFISNGVSVPNIQMWPALRYLLRQGLIESDALCLPGHTGDFISGAHLSGDTRIADDLTLPNIALAIYHKHYQLDKLPVTQPLLERILLTCKELMGQYSDWTAEDLIEAWNWQERQSKFIVNSNRYYEFFQLEWWLPFWQLEFVAFWLQVPKPMLRKQQLWRKFVDLECQQSGISTITGNAANLSRLPSVLTRGLNYFFDRNLLLWLVPFRSWLLYRLRLKKHSGTLNSYLARRILRTKVCCTKVVEN